MRNGHSALFAIFMLHAHTATLLHGPGMPRCPLKRRHLVLGILLHLRRNAHSCLVVPLAQAPLLSQLPFQLVDVLTPLITEPLPLLPLQRISHVTSQRHAARACPVIGMSCSCNCLFKEWSLPLDCCNTLVKASSMRPCLVQRRYFRLVLCKTLADVSILHFFPDSL